MEIHKRRFKGSFLSFFDWNGKSQKKLLCHNPKLPEVLRQGKESMVDSMPKSQIKMDDHGATPSNKASCDLDCALSINSDEGCGTKAPGLVARLMGLDSLPVSIVSDLSSSSTSLYGSNSLGSSHSHEDALHPMVNYCCPVDPTNMPLKLEKSSWSVLELKAQKVGIKRFQTEMLPPKSAKPIPVTHNKLLSPIRNPGYGYIQHKNATHIMEAASKICMRNRMSSVGPSSVSFRIVDLKEKLEAAQYKSKFMDTHTNPLRGKPSERRNLYKSTPSFKGSINSHKKSSRQLASKGKSVSLAMPSKTDVQSRDELTLNGNRVCMKKKEQNDIKSNQLPRSQKKQITDRARVMQQRTCKGQNSNVLGKNNQKQNSVTNKGNSTSKVDSNKPTRTWFSESSTGARKTKNKGAVNANIEPKRSGARVTDTPKEYPVSKRKSISQKKNYINRDVHNEARFSDDAANNYENKSIKCNITTAGSIDQDAFSMKGSNGVISFTFTSPLRKGMPESQSSSEQGIRTRNKIDVNSCNHSDKLYPKKLSLSPPRLHVIDGDALSILLEKKLQELTSRINPAQCSRMIEGSSANLRSSLEDSSKFQTLVSSKAREKYRSFHHNQLSTKLDTMHDNCLSSQNMMLNMNQQLQTSESMEEPSYSSNSESRIESYLDSAYGSTVHSSMQDEEVSNFSPMNESISLENDAKWFEQSFSIVMMDNMTMEQSSVMSDSVEFTRSTRNVEFEYVNDILNNAELMTEEYVVGETAKIIMPNLFDLLENKSIWEENYEEHSKIERKAIFDTLSECLELRCRQVFVGSCKAWPRWVASVKRKSSLAEELYKEMLGLRSMEEEVVVDELVCKDMRTPWGKWLNFDIEAFEEGLELEFDIVTYLINELVSDMLHV
ncbi:hypothetical protein Fmac_024636 [Flemingia macrophylla]|uniref:DUF4378 domain-containing protein n=1 Tax=Flemingia macrophylla TaxID=520843 RepID=A0ABD1LQH7_9FABA